MMYNVFMHENSNIEPNLIKSLQQQNAANNANAFPLCENIDDVSKSVSVYLKKHPLKIILPIVAIFCLVFIYFILDLNFDISIIFIIFISIIFSVYASAQKKIQQQFMQQFAQQNNFTYVTKGIFAEYDGTLFKYGHSKNATNQVSGNYHDCPLTLFNYNYTTGSGKNRVTHYYTVFSLHLHTITPNFLLENKTHRFSYGLFDNNVKGKSITLEGNFNNFFSLRVAPGDEIETLQILTPDIMEDLIAKAKHLSVEIINDHFFIYANKTIGNKNELYEVYDLAKYFIEKLTPLLRQMKGGLEQEQRERNGIK